MGLPNCETPEKVSKVEFPKRLPNRETPGKVLMSGGLQASSKDVSNLVLVELVNLLPALFCLNLGNERFERIS